MYMFKSLKQSMREVTGGIDNMIELDELHQRILANIHHQSDKDFPRGSVRNGILDWTKCQSSDQRGNLFQLLCLSFTTAGKSCLSPVWSKLGITGGDFRSFIKLYLTMEE